MTDAIRRLRARVKDLVDLNIDAATRVLEGIRTAGAAQQDAKHAATIRRSLEFAQEQIEAGKQLGGNWSDAALERRTNRLKDLIGEIETLITAAKALGPVEGQPDRYRDA